MRYDDARACTGFALRSAGARSRGTRRRRRTVVNRRRSTGTTSRQTRAKVGIRTGSHAGVDSAGPSNHRPHVCRDPVTGPRRPAVAKLFSPLFYGTSPNLRGVSSRFLLRSDFTATRRRRRVAAAYTPRPDRLRPGRRANRSADSLTRTFRRTYVFR